MRAALLGTTSTMAIAVWLLAEEGMRDREERREREAMATESRVYATRMTESANFRAMPLPPGYRWAEGGGIEPVPDPEWYGADLAVGPDGTCMTEVMRLPDGTLLRRRISAAEMSRPVRAVVRTIRVPGDFETIAAALETVRHGELLAGEVAFDVAPDHVEIVGGHDLAAITRAMASITTEDIGRACRDIARRFDAEDADA